MNKPGHKQIEVQIMGQSYLLSCPVGGESLLLEAVERVDTAMCRIRDAGKVKARDRIAVLASLNLAKFVAEDGRVVQRLSWSEGLSWIERRGMIEVARDIERCDPHNDARTEDET